MRRLTTWLAGAAGGLAAYRAFARRRPALEPASAEPDTRAGELRERLVHAREASLATPEAEPAQEPVPAAGPEARRHSVHEQARAAIDEMRGD